MTDANAWKRAHVVTRDPQSVGKFVKDSAVVADVPPDSVTSPEPDLGGIFRSSGASSEERRTGFWRTITPNVVPLSNSCWRLYYTQSGHDLEYNKNKTGVPNSPARVLSAISTDAETWHPEPGVRLAPHENGASLRALCPDVVPTHDGRGWRMFYEAQPAGIPGCSHVPPSCVRSAISTDGLTFVPEFGVRLGNPRGKDSYGSPRCVYMPNGAARLYAHRNTPHGAEIISATCASPDEIAGPPDFRFEGVCIAQELDFETLTVYAPEVVRWKRPDDTWGWRMYYAGWAQSNLGTRGYILTAVSEDGSAGSWTKDFAPVLKPGARLDRVKCSEPCVYELPSKGQRRTSFRLMYEACDGTADGETGVWRILSATAAL